MEVVESTVEAQGRGQVLRARQSKSSISSHPNQLLELATQTCKGFVSCLLYVYVIVYVPTLCKWKPMEIYLAVMSAMINQLKFDFIVRTTNSLLCEWHKNKTF